MAEAGPALWECGPGADGKTLRQTLTAVWCSKLRARKGGLSARGLRLATAPKAGATPRAAGLTVEKWDLVSQRGEPRKERREK